MTRPAPSTPPVLGRRAAAFGVDAVLALLVTGGILAPFLSIAPPDVWQRMDPVPLMWAVALVLLGILSGGRTPGKRWLRLDVRGAGCIACRELRRIGWVLPAALAEFFHAGLSPQTTNLMLAASLFLVAWALSGPWRRGGEFGHNAATGFTVAPAA